MSGFLLLAGLLTADAAVRDAPAFQTWGDLGRFPPAAALEGPEKLACDYLDHVAARRYLDCDICPWVGDLHGEQYRVWMAYYLLRRARETACWGVREDYAQRLRELLSDGAYMRGVMPAPVP